MTSNLVCFLYSGVILLLATGPNQRIAMANKFWNELSGVYISISLESLVSVTEVKDDKVTSKNVGFLGDRQRMRSPCVSCPHGYDSLWSNATNQLIVPDVNALKIVNEDGTYDRTVTLDNCNPYSMHSLLHDHSILWVLCNPVGNEAQVYRVSLMNLTTELPLVVHTDPGLFLPQVGVIFETNGVLHVLLATVNGLVFASQDTPRAHPVHLSVTCMSVLRITEFNYIGQYFLMECGNSTSQTVVNTYLCDYDFDCSSVHLRSYRKLGKIITSDDVSILASVAPNGIDFLEWNQGRFGRVFPSSNHKFHDAYIESIAGSHTLVYSDKGGKVHLYDISTALNGEDISSQTIEGDYVTCKDCSGLVRIREGYFATATDLEGVAWFSIAPPKLLRTSVAIKADRLAYSSSQLPSQDVNLSVTVIIVVVVIGSVVAVGIILCLLIVVILCWKKKSTCRKESPGVHWVQCQQSTDGDGPAPGQIAALNPIAFNVDPGVILQPHKLNGQDSEKHPEPRPRAGENEGVMVTNSGKEGTKDGREPIPGQIQGRDSPRLAVGDKDYSEGVRQSPLGANYDEPFSLRLVPRMNAFLTPPKVNLTPPKAFLIPAKVGDVLKQAGCFVLGEIQTITIPETGGEWNLYPFPNDKGETCAMLSAPPGVVPSGETAVIVYGVIPSGPFVFPDGLELASVLIYLDCNDKEKLQKPLSLSLKHCIMGDDEVLQNSLCFVKASHTPQDGSFVFKPRSNAVFDSESGTLEFTDFCLKGICVKKACKEIEEISTRCYAVPCKIAINRVSYEYRICLIFGLPSWENVLREYYCTRIEYNREIHLPQEVEFKADGPIQSYVNESDMNGNGWQMVKLCDSVAFMELEIALLKLCKMKCERIIGELEVGLIFPHVRYVVTSEIEPKPETHGNRIVFLTLQGCKPKDVCFFIFVQELRRERTPEGAEDGEGPSLAVRQQSPIGGFVAPGTFENRFLERTPSDAGLLEVVDKIKLGWRKIAIYLGLPLTDVVAFESDQDLGGLRALQQWRDGKEGCRTPSTWNTLLTVVKDKLGGVVHADLEREVMTHEHWSIRRY